MAAKKRRPSKGTASEAERPALAPDCPVFDPMLAEMAMLEGRLIDLHESTLDPWALGAARVLEGLRLCLGTVKIASVADLATGKVRDRAEVLNGVAAQLLHEAQGKGARSSHAHGELGRQALALRSLLADHLRRRGPRDIDTLALVLHYLPASDVVKQPPLDSPAFAEWVSAFRSHLDDGLAERDEQARAEAIVLAAAKASGVPRPSALFDAEAKRIKRGAK